MQSLPFVSFLAPLLVALGLAAADPALATNRAGVAAPSAGVVPTCDWDRPGHNPFMGDVVAAVDRYQDIPADVRERLKARMVKRSYDDVVTIRRDSIEGKARYGTTIRDMHFGSSQICRSVTRTAWSPQMQERGLVYCDGGDCILVPTVCRNVSRIARAQVAHEKAEGDGPPLAVMPALPDEVVPGAKADLPSGLAGMDAKPALSGSLDNEVASFAAAAAVGGGPGGGLYPGIGGQGGGSSAAGSPGVGAAAAASGTELPGSVAAVPEPETWCLLMGGLAALAAASRRRRAAIGRRRSWPAQ